MTGPEALQALRESDKYVRIKRKEWDSDEYLQRHIGQKKISASYQYEASHGCYNDCYRAEEIMEICLSDFLYDDWEVVE
jgi:cytochrome b involved in lipid metabolism